MISPTIWVLFTQRHNVCSHRLCLLANGVQSLVRLSGLPRYQNRWRWEDGFGGWRPTCFGPLRNLKARLPDLLHGCTGLLASRGLFSATRRLLLGGSQDFGLQAPFEIFGGGAGFAQLPLLDHLPSRSSSLPTLRAHRRSASVELAGQVTRTHGKVNKFLEFGQGGE